ncbi:twitching motility protein PilT [Anaerobranca californiensis DSM 14826]|uniref:Twitching motility protein PilT n=1 Tax=Anaerobranca californiensis DSM 14826 TaxID=1120989 RepID=A0A1M6LBI3_9FIRM|nr:type IV pilus twitching motility protein PilT [Anaerobranca californiensis]SHJ68536.1 twitching motility protein PilT [Anaerobranca californiensis DSM 14826]
MIFNIFANAVNFEASDIHLTVNSPVIYRINGKLHSVSSELLTPEKLQEYATVLLEKTGYKGDLDEFTERDFSFELPGVNRFRVNVFKQRGYFSISARIIPNIIPKWRTLGLPDTILEFTKLKKGLVLVTGPTGSGKSTTLAALLDIINTNNPCHIITLEDPIEFIHKNKKAIVNQREIGKDTKSFNEGLRAAMRQDPDVILVGEMRDFDTIQTAITAAETGHLVFVTLHTVSAAKTIDRIIDVFPGSQQNQIRTQLAETLQGVVAQQLLPTLDGRRIVAVEVLKVNTAVQNLIRENKTYQLNSVIETGSKLGMISMEQSLKNLRYRGIISEETFNEYLEVSR